jgi:uncharacterized protein DUF481
MEALMQCRGRRAVRVGLVTCALALGLCLPRSAAAQIVNVQPLITDPRRQGLDAAIDASLDVRTGNTQLLLVSGSALVRYRHQRQLVFLLARQDYGTEGGERFLSKDFEHLRYRLTLTEALELECFVQHDRDEFRRLAWRAVWGAGPRFPVVATDAVDLAFGIAYMEELERLDHAPEPDAGQQQLAHRLSTYVAFALRLNERVRAGQTVYAQPRFSQPKDIRVLSETELLVALGTVVSLKATVSLGYDSYPPDGRHALDTVTKMGLQLRLR